MTLFQCRGDRHYPVSRVNFSDGERKQYRLSHFSTAWQWQCQQRGLETDNSSSHDVPVAFVLVFPVSCLQQHKPVLWGCLSRFGGSFKKEMSPCSSLSTVVPFCTLLISLHGSYYHSGADLNCCSLQYLFYKPLIGCFSLEPGYSYFKPSKSGKG